MSVKELLHGGMLKGPLHTKTGGTNAFAGVTQIASGSVTVQVSSSVVKSDSIVLTGLQSLTDTSSGFGPNVEVRTLTTGGFILAHSDGKAQARDVNVHWILMNQ